MTYGSYGWGVQYSNPCSTYQVENPWNHSSIRSTPFCCHWSLYTLWCCSTKTGSSCSPPICCRKMWTRRLCTHTNILSSLWLLLFIHHNNRLQIFFQPWVCLGACAILLCVFLSKTLWQPVMLHHSDQTKTVSPWIIKYHTMGKVLPPKDYWLSIIYFLCTRHCWRPYYRLLQFVNNHAYFIRSLSLYFYGWLCMLFWCSYTIGKKESKSVTITILPPLLTPGLFTILNASTLLASSHTCWHQEGSSPHMYKPT